MPPASNRKKQTIGPNLSFEIEAGAPHTLVCGIDEAGRGPLAGPVVAAAVVLNHDCFPDGLDDSKKLDIGKREALYAELVVCAQYGVGIASVEEIDEINILWASMLAMTRALAALPRAPHFALIDGNRLPRQMPCPARAIIGGDALALSIAAASIIAKVTRDRMMVELAEIHPGYGWESNRGYSTRSHFDGLARLGVTPHHRRSFEPIRNMLSPDLLLGLDFVVNER